MKKHYTDEKTGISYTLHGDYYLPDFALPAEEEIHIGIWGQRHAAFLKKHKRNIYNECRFCAFCQNAGTAKRLTPPLLCPRFQNESVFF